MTNMKPYYFRSGFRDITLEAILVSTPWVQVAINMMSWAGRAVP